MTYDEEILGYGIGIGLETSTPCSPSRLLGHHWASTPSGQSLICWDEVIDPRSIEMAEMMTHLVVDHVEAVSPYVRV